MKKIVSVLQPFALEQNLIVYEDGNKIEIVSTSIEELNATVLKLVDKYNIEEIQFAGAKKYAKGLGKKILEAELLSYGKNKLNIKYI